MRTCGTDPLQHSVGDGTYTPSLRANVGERRLERRDQMRSVVVRRPVVPGVESDRAGPIERSESGEERVRGYHAWPLEPKPPGHPPHARLVAPDRPASAGGVRAPNSEGLVHDDPLARGRVWIPWTQRAPRLRHHTAIGVHEQDTSDPRMIRQRRREPGLREGHATHHGSLPTPAVQHADHVARIERWLPADGGRGRLRHRVQA